MSLYQIVLSLHGLFGLVALATFWIAGFARKGSPLHKRAGKVYLAAMAALLVPALPLAIRILLERSTTGGVFLVYLWVLTVTSTWLSWRAIRDKRDWKKFAGPVFHVLMWANLASALVVVVTGVFFAESMQVIIVSFSIVGFLGFWQMRRFARQAPSDPRWWLEQHLGGMIGNGVATHIAFLASGLPKRLALAAGPVLSTNAWPGPLGWLVLQIIAWVGPLAWAFLARWVLGRKFLPARVVVTKAVPG